MSTQAETNLSFQRNEACPTNPAPRCVVPDAPAGLFLHAPTWMCQYVLCSVLLGDEPSSPHCPTCKNVIFFLFSILYISPHFAYNTPLTALPSSAFKASWMAAGLSDQHLAQVMCLYKHMGFSSQIITDKPMADD